MSITKIKAIRGTVEKAISYITDPAKTDDKLLVSSYGCAVESAAKEFEWTRNIAEQRGMRSVKILARHVIQSFDVGEVTPELAHQIGQQFADELLNGKYEYVISTHIDKDHVHNHIIFNAVDFVDHHAYKSYKKVYYDMREINDRICKENGLSVVPPSQGKGMGYKEYTEAKQGTSWKQKLRQTIDRCVITAKDFDDFLRLMQESGYEIKSGKYISFRAEGQERFTRSKTIGENYTEDRIRERIQGRVRKKVNVQTERRGVSLVIDIQNSIKAQENKGYEQWAKVFNLKQAAKTLNYLTENGLTTYSDLQAKYDEIHSEYSRIGTALKDVEARMREGQLVIKNLSNYRRLKPVQEAYSKAKNKAEFREKHSAVLIIFDAARKTLAAIYKDKKPPNLKDLQAEQQRLTVEQQRLYDERAKVKKQVGEIDTIRENVNSLLNRENDRGVEILE